MSVGEAAELDEGEDVEGEVNEVLMGLGEEGERACTGHLVEYGAPRAAASKVMEGGEIVAVGVEGGVWAGQWVVGQIKRSS